jgi:hypothetical protein
MPLGNSLVLWNEDLLGEILQFIGEESCFPFFLSSCLFKHCVEKVFKQRKSPCIKYYCCRVELVIWALRWYPQLKQSDSLMRYAAGAGSLEVVKWAVSESFPWSIAVTNQAAANGRIETLQWLRSHVPPCPWGGSTACAAARAGRVDVLQMLADMEPPCPIDESCGRIAAYCGHTDVLIWLREQNPPYPCDGVVLYYAAWKGSLSLLRYLVSTGAAALDALTLVGAIQSDVDSMQKVQWLTALSPPCPWASNACTTAAMLYKIHILVHLRSLAPPCPWSEDTCTKAARNGDIQLLTWLRESHPPCPWSSRVCEAAVAGNSIETLRWLRSEQHDIPCPWNSTCCAIAAKNGSIEILEYLREAEPFACPWDERVCRAAMEQRGGAYSSLRWLRRQEPPCPWDIDTAARAAELCLI